MPDRKRIRIPWVASVLTVVVLLSAGFAVQPVRDAATSVDVAEAYLTRPLSYLVLAPISSSLDTLTLLSLRQHIALFIGVVIAFVAWRVAVARSRGATMRRHLVASLVLLLVIVGTYAAAVLLPRPMAALVSDNANFLIVDFHSHTQASHDGRGGWDAERNRAWHRAAGYGAAFVTDHATVTAAEQGVADNPFPADVTLLQGIEVTWNGEHVTILGAERTYRGLLTANLRDVDEQALALASFIAGREPVVIWNHPRDLTRLPAATGSRTAGVRGIEIVNGSPRDMDRLRSQRAAIAALAEQRNIALTGGSDHHGWGRAAPAWTLMRISGWRGMRADSLAMHIERALRESGFRGTRVVERRVADPGDMPLALWLTSVIAPWRMFTTLSNEERVVWVLWIWLAWSAVWLSKRARRSSA